METDQTKPTPPTPGKGRPLLGAVVGLGVVLAYQAVTAPPEAHNVEFRIEGSFPEARVSHEAAGGSVIETVRVPWVFSVRLPHNRPISLIGTGSYDSPGRLRCVILVDGQPWREASASGPGAMANCHGIIGSP